jgi:hypothetical protein
MSVSLPSQVPPSCLSLLAISTQHFISCEVRRHGSHIGHFVTIVLDGEPICISEYHTFLAPQIYIFTLRHIDRQAPSTVADLEYSGGYECPVCWDTFYTQQTLQVITHSNPNLTNRPHYSIRRIYPALFASTNLLIPSKSLRVRTTFHIIQSRAYINSRSVWNQL